MTEPGSKVIDLMAALKEALAREKIPDEEALAARLKESLAREDSEGRAPDGTEAALARNYSDPASDLSTQADRGHFPNEIVPGGVADELDVARDGARVILSPSETRGKWRSFSEYVGSDPESNVPGIRVDGWIDQDGVRWVRATPTEAPELKIVFENAEYLPPIFLVRYDGSSKVRMSARKVRRARAELSKRGL